MVAKWTGDLFTRGIYDMHIIELKHVPLLEVLPEKQMDFLQVRDVMAPDPIMFQEVELISNLVAKQGSHLGHSLACARVDMLQSKALAIAVV